MISTTDRFSSADRVRNHTRESVNRRIDRATRERVRWYRGQPRDVISRRIRELDQEWDIERYLEMNASALAFAGVLLGATAGRKWLLLSGTVLGFLFQHAVQGWCPPLRVFRVLGVRTRSEIDEEKYALKQLRGDFDHARVRSAATAPM